MYCSQTQVETYLIGYNVSNTATLSIVTDSISDSKNEIDKFLCGRYDVSVWSTVTSTPPLVQSLSKWLASSYVMEAISKGSKESLARVDRLQKRVMQNLEQLASGELKLTDSTGNVIDQIADAESVYSTTDNYSNTFNEDSPFRWKADKTKLEDISSERS